MGDTCHTHTHRERDRKKKKKREKEKTYRPQLLGILLDRLGIQHLSVVLAHVEVLGIVLGQDDLLLVVAQLEVRHVVLLLLGHLLTAGLLFIALFLLLLQLLGRLLGPPRQVPRADLAAQDAGLRPVAALDAQRHLGQDELGLLAPVHRAKRLDLQLAQDVSGRLEVALLLLDVRQDLGHARPLHLDKDLALGHGAQRLNHRQLRLEARRLVQEAHDCLHHARDGLLELAMLLGQHERLVVEQVPVAGILAHRDDGDEHPGCRGEIRRLHFRYMECTHQRPSPNF